MITIFVDFTAQEKAQIQAIEDKYEKAFKIVDEIINSRTDEQKDFLAYVKYPEKLTKAEYERIKKENEVINAANDKIYKEWIEAGSPEWRAACLRWDELNEAFNNERTELFRNAEARQFKELGDDPTNIFEDAKKQVKKAIQSQYSFYKEKEKKANWFSSVHVCALEDGAWLLDEEELRATINGTLHLHIEVLKQHDDLLKKLENFITKTLKSNKHVAPPGHPGKFKRVEFTKETLSPAAMVNTKYPVNFLSPKKQAEVDGAITCLSSYSATITDKHFRYALTPLENNAAYIQQLDENFIQQLEFNTESGIMSFKQKSHEPIQIKNAATNQSIKELDLQLLRSLYTIIYQNATSISTDTVTVYLPTLTKHLGIRTSNSKPNDLFKKIRAFENTVGVFSGGAIYKLLDFLKYEPEGNLITFASPYMNMILRQLGRKNIKENKKGVKYINPHHSFLVHSNMANERNKPAVEVVQVIVTLLQQRGEIKNNITTASIKFSTIIDQIPELREKLIGDTTTGNKNNYLRRTFKKAYELLRSKTDLYQYYNSLSIPEIIPSTTTIDQVITISHNGKNQNYKQP